MTHRVLVSIFFTATMCSFNSFCFGRSSFDIKQYIERYYVAKVIPQQKDSNYIKEEYSNIIRVIQTGDNTFIDADYVQFLTGQAAVDAALKEHEAEKFETKDRKTDFSVPGDYYIVNESNKIRRILLSENCVFDLVFNLDKIPPVNENSLKNFEMIYKESLFILTIDIEGKVTKIKEVFLP